MGISANRHCPNSKLGPARCSLGILAIALGVLSSILLRCPQARAEIDVTTTPPVTLVRSGNRALEPNPGVGGFTPCPNPPNCPPPTTNFKPYIIPGQDEDHNNDPNQIDQVKIIRSYRALLGAKPTQTSDWWASLGLQVKGFVLARQKSEGQLARSQTFATEPFSFDFVDFVAQDQFPGYKFLPSGLRIWNRNDLSMSIDGRQLDPNNGRNSYPVYNAALNYVGYGPMANQGQTAVTVGLEGLHPLRADEFPASDPPNAPWTNVLVDTYSDWGVVASVGRAVAAKSTLRITMANGSPFVWFERVSGTAPFRVWVGGAPLGSGDPFGGNYTQLFNDPSGVLAIKAVTGYVDQENAGKTNSTAEYVLFADKGAWLEDTKNLPTPKPSNATMYVNTSATAVAVLAVPHNLLDLTPALLKQMVLGTNGLQQFACRRITNTLFDYPPFINQVTIGGQAVSLGYDPKTSTVTSDLRFITAEGVPPWNSFQGCTKPGGPALLMLFPHHRKALIPTQLNNIIGGANSPTYIWNTQLGPAYGYAGRAEVKGDLAQGSIVQRLTVGGLLPFLPSVGLQSKTADQDVYSTMKTWFFLQEPILPTCKVDNPTDCTTANLGSVMRNVGSYDNPGTNTYIDGTITIREAIAVADELAHDSQLAPKIDPQLGKSPQDAAVEMRNALVQSLEELVSRWADIYTSQFFQYNRHFDTIYGWPAGFGAASHFNDHHFHYGYFLRAAAAIGRYDPKWLNAYEPLIEELVQDVANLDRGNIRYPVLRNFNPFYGHSWADGTAYGVENQESSSEAISFAAGLFEVGQILNRSAWSELGLYLYEQEVLSAQQYWFNQDADLTLKTGNCKTVPGVNPVNNTCYNANWPASFVTFDSPNPLDSQNTNFPVKGWHTTLLGKVNTSFLDRTTFFGPIDTTFAVQFLPLSASLLYLGRNQAWLQANWQQFLLETGKYIEKPDPNNGGQKPTLTNVYDDAIAGIQALMPDNGDGTVNGTGLAAALKRINGPNGDGQHKFYDGAVNTVAKHWAYTNSTLGQVDATVVANIPSYGVFLKGNTRTCVAYNPSDMPINNVKFFLKANPNQTVCTQLSKVPPDSMVTAGGSSATDTIANISPPAGRFYLRKTTAGTGDCSEATSPCDLKLQPGAWMPPTSTGPFPQGVSFNPNKPSEIKPSDYGSLKGSLVVVPIRSDRYTGIGANVPPPPSDIQEWIGSFSGKLVNDPLCTTTPCDPNKNLQAITRMAIYTDQCLNPGWQRCRVPDDENGNALTVKISYWWNKSDFQAGKTPNRAEIYANFGLDGSDTFIDNSKLTEYFFQGINLAGANPTYTCAETTADACTSGFNGSYGLNLTLNKVPGTFPATCLTNIDKQTGLGVNCASFPANANFPAVVRDGKIAVEIWGAFFGSNKGLLARPVPVSADADPLTGRASWIKPPYN